ncbi:hypothetical protein LTR56_023306 [Elasticomyces elasticus]|nr:hypothetical protein LTR56_023306 [Elasticomyces elasticus]KAK3629855.1 hypothetical protein LTR22_021748 [Elasticomyces elasticus]KAK4908822.1 hypothetical protein LTR49_022326 [Elasticomyces elasticus]KAK5744440.1 hypothetical protein LTS12_023482 [Elasticomyces elasticus]
MQFSYTNNCLSSTIEGSYTAAPPLANGEGSQALVTIAGAEGLPKGMSLTIAGQPCEVGEVALEYDSGVLRVSGLEELTPSGAWEGEMKMKLIY